MPCAGVAGRSAVVPTGTTIAPVPTTSNSALGEVVAIPTFTLSAPVPPNTIEPEAVTVAFYPD